MKKNNLRAGFVYLTMLFSLLLIFSVFCICCTSDEQDDLPKTKLLLGDGFGIGKTTLLVQDLDSARNYFTDVLGFSMPTPDKYDKGLFDSTLSASVHFEDFTSFDLLSTKDSTENLPIETANLFKNKRLGLYSFSTSSVDTTIKWLHAQEFKTDSIKTGRADNEVAKGWDWDDGGPQWRSLDFEKQEYLPSFIEYAGLPYEAIQAEWKPAAWRKYYESNPNGVVSIMALQVVVADLKASITEFEKMGLTLLESKDNFARFSIAHDQELYITTPASSDDALSKILKTNGQGVYSIRFGIKNLKETEDYLKKNLSPKAMAMDTVQKKLTVSKEFAYGIELEFIEESKENAAIAKIFDYKEGSKLDSTSLTYASDVYTKYCALCHGKDREGYAADNAPSLKSYSLMATTLKPKSSYNYLAHTIEYGREGTAMAPYAKSQGGPLDGEDIDLLLFWLHELSGVEKPIELSTEPIKGDINLGKTLFAKNCATCHGTKGEGTSAPALANPMLLATASDAFLHYTISEGREGTPMRAFKDSLSKKEINALTAYLRSRASGWNAPSPISVADPLPENYVLNPDNKAPKFDLREGKYVSAKQLLKALQDSTRMIILDARSKAAWQQTHIPGAISVPYYAEPDKFIKNLPNDNTMIVAYCACPHAASSRVINTLKRYGYKHTAVLDEGILVWTQRGYPVEYGK